MAYQKTGTFDDLNAAQRRPRPCKSCGRVFEPRFAAQRTCDDCLGRNRRKEDA